MCSSFLLFAGTTEGRHLAAQLAQAGKQVVVCVATDYGKAVIPPQKGIMVSTGRMSSEEMQQLMEQGRFCCVVDATHPYAVEVTKNIKQASLRANLPYFRLLRAETKENSDVISVASPTEAAQYLAEHSGNALLTTGSKDLPAFTEIKDFAQRLYPRILPMAQAVENCCRLGYQSKNIIAMQGPFSVELNTAMLRHTNSQYMVTKNSGDIGGFGEKQEAARQAGAKLIVIERPSSEEGFSYADLLPVLLKMEHSMEK